MLKLKLLDSRMSESGQIFAASVLLKTENVRSSRAQQNEEVNIFAKGCPSFRNENIQFPQHKLDYPDRNNGRKFLVQGR